MHASEWQAKGPLTERLDTLREGVADRFAAALQHARLGAARAVEVAALLAEARAACSAKEWATWLASLEIPEPTVRACLDVHRLALDGAAVVALGGLGLAQVWAQGVHLPPEDEALAVSLGEWTEERHVPVGYVWRAAEGGFYAGVIDFHDPNSRGVATRKPVHDERALWATLWALLNGRHAEMIFRPIREDAGLLVPALEAHRQALIKGGVSIVH